MAPADSLFPEYVFHTFFSVKSKRRGGGGEGEGEGERGRGERRKMKRGYLHSVVIEGVGARDADGGSIDGGNSSSCIHIIKREVKELI